MSQSPLFNAKDRPLNQLAGTLPDVSGALFDYFQEMTFTTIVKSVVNFQVVETPTNIVFQGLWQPFTGRQLSMRPEGQRKWKYSNVFSQINLSLTADDVLSYLGVQYRVLRVNDYSLYQYYQYELVEDFTGSGPNS